ncbi:MAG: hypothetical protein ABEH61_01290, partial [Haloarculaceae archaeon]
MSDSRRDTAGEVSGLVGDLARTVEELQTELEPGGRSPLRPPTPRELARFTSEVTIPAIVLALETNVRVLKLLQRSLRLAAGEEPRSGTTTQARERAEALGRRTLSRFDDVLADLQSALEGRPPEDPARELLAEARTLRAEIDDRLATAEPDRQDGALDDGMDSGATDGVDVDVESELQSIKDDLDDPPDDDPPDE